jgi:hypothetical protein
VREALVPQTTANRRGTQSREVNGTDLVNSAANQTGI